MFKRIIQKMREGKNPRCRMKITLFTLDNPKGASTSIKGNHLILQFYEALVSMGNEDAADIIMAHKKNVKLWSYVEKYAAHNFMEFMVVIKEVKPNSFTMMRIGGVANGFPVEVIETIETDFIYEKCGRVPSASGMFLPNYVIFMHMNHHRMDNLMSYLVLKNKPEALRAHLDRNESMEPERTDEPTPFQLACLHGREEIVAMFVYYNVTPNLPAIQLEDKTYYRHAPIYYAIDDDNIVDMLIDYTFDKWSDFHLDFLLQLMFNGSPNLDRVLQILNEHSDTMTLFFASRSTIDDFWLGLSTVRECYLKRGLAFFLKERYSCDSLMEGFDSNRWDYYWVGRTMRNEIDRKIFFENLHCLGEAFCEGADGRKPTLLQMMMDKLERPLHRVVTEQFVPYAEIEPIILLLLSNNAPLDAFSFDHILRFALTSGRSTLFDACRFMDVDRTREMSLSIYRNYEGPVASSYYHQFPLVRTVTDVLRDPANIHEFDLPFYVKMSSHPMVKKKLMELADSRPEMRTLLDDLPEFPTLLEFARDAARKYVVEQCNVKNSWQFYEAVKKLEICEYLKKIITYDVNTPLYNRSIRADYP